jgi:hypothetical protein
VLVGVEVEAQAETSGTNSGTNGQNGGSLESVESNDDTTRTKNRRLAGYYHQSRRADSNR